MKRFLFTLLAFVAIIAGYLIINKETLFTRVDHPTRLTYSGNGVEFEYPESFGATIWRPLDWPPAITVVTQEADIFAQGCPALKDLQLITTSGGGTSNAGSYRFYQGEDAGAGSLFTTLCYIFSGDAKYYVLPITIRSHTGCGHDQCGAYCDTPQEQACKDFDFTTDVVSTIETIISTFKIIE